MPLDKLPDELLLPILMRLPTPDLAHVASLNRALRHAFSQVSLWYNMLILRFSRDDVPAEHDLASVRAHYLHLQSLRIPSCDMYICHADAPGSPYWSRRASAASRYNSVAFLVYVWWMDFHALFRGVPSGAYRVEWHLYSDASTHNVDDVTFSVQYAKSLAAEEDVDTPPPPPLLSERISLTSSDHRPFLFIRLGPPQEGMDSAEGWSIKAMSRPLRLHRPFQDVTARVHDTGPSAKSNLSVDYCQLVPITEEEALAMENAAGVSNIE